MILNEILGKPSVQYKEDIFILEKVENLFTAAGLSHKLQHKKQQKYGP